VAQGVEMTQEQFTEVVKSLDKDGNSEIDMGEFMAFMCDFHGHSAKQATRAFIEKIEVTSVLYRYAKQVCCVCHSIWRHGCVFTLPFRSRRLFGTYLRIAKIMLGTLFHAGGLSWAKPLIPPRPTGSAWFAFCWK